MNNMRRGFTMIELIFVIVIIGILAAVAIPKLAATRSNASASTCVHEIGSLIQELGAAYTQNGQTEFEKGTVPDFSNVTVGASAADTTPNKGLEIAKAGKLTTLTNKYYFCDAKKLAKFSYASGALTVDTTGNEAGSSDVVTVAVKELKKGALGGEVKKVFNF